MLRTFTVRENYLVLGPKASGSDEAARIGRAIYDTLDADKEHFVVLASAGLTTIFRDRGVHDYLIEYFSHAGNAAGGLHRHQFLIFSRNSAC